MKPLSNAIYKYGNINCYALTISPTHVEVNIAYYPFSYTPAISKAVIDSLDVAIWTCYSTVFCEEEAS